MKVKKIVRIIAICLFTFIGYSSSDAQNFEAQSELLAFNYASDSFSLSGNGSIEKAGDIYMTLDVRNGYVTGKYYYEKVNKGRRNKQWISLVGTYNFDEYSITLTEDSGTFYGQLMRIQGGMLYTGTFVRKDGRKFDFSITF